MMVKWILIKLGFAKKQANGTTQVRVGGKDNVQIDVSTGGKSSQTQIGGKRNTQIIK